MLSSNPQLLLRRPPALSHPSENKSFRGYEKPSVHGLRCTGRRPIPGQNECLFTVATIERRISHRGQRIRVKTTRYPRNLKWSACRSCIADRSQRVSPGCWRKRGCGATRVSIGPALREETFCGTDAPHRPRRQRRVWQEPGGGRH
jgi:hypothetical protein